MGQTERKGANQGETDAGGLFNDLSDHPLRHQLLGEVHARPFPLLTTPRRILHYAFLTNEDEAGLDRDRLGRLMRAHGKEPPQQAKFITLDLGKASLRWEQHSEFTSYTFETGLAAASPFQGKNFADVLPDFSLTAPGKLIAAAQIALVRKHPDSGLSERLFDQASLSLSEVDDGAARIVTDFLADATGASRILIEDEDLGPSRAGALVQRLLELETYRVLALLALPEAQRLAPIVRRIEMDLTDITAEMRDASGYSDNRDLLNRLTVLAAELETQSAATSYRFAASRAYAEIVEQRIKDVREIRVPGFRTWEAFLVRRMSPAMRTCRALELRQRDLSEKLARAANLLRTRVDIELEQQNRSLLQSMNRRAKLQLRLQQTVEGLSVAAISYYIVGLIGYLSKGGKAAGLDLPSGLIEALSVPIVVLAVWWIVRRVRRIHNGG